MIRSCRWFLSGVISFFALLNAFSRSADIAGIARRRSDGCRNRRVKDDLEGMTDESESSISISEGFFGKMGEGERLEEKGGQ
jgi:hypothetical protein